MRKIRELLRLKYELGRSHREIAASLGIANSTDESGDRPVVVLLSLKVDARPGGLLRPGVPDVPLHSISPIRDAQQAKRQAAESPSGAVKQVTKEVDHDLGSLLEFAHERSLVIGSAPRP